MSAGFELTPGCLAYLERSALVAQSLSGQDDGQTEQAFAELGQLWEALSDTERRAVMLERDRRIDEWFSAVTRQRKPLAWGPIWLLLAWVFILAGAGFGFAGGEKLGAVLAASGLGCVGLSVRAERRAARRDGS